MYKLLLLLIFYLVTQSANGKSLFEYNVNPEYDLLAEESRSYSNFWPSSEFDGSYEQHKHYRRGGRHGRGFDRRGYGPPPHPHSFDHPHSSEEYGDDGDISYDYPQHHHHHNHPHGFPPGQGKKHGHRNGHPHEPPRRFPPPPVYDKDFINPWDVPSPTAIKPVTVQQPPATTPAVYIAPKLTTSTTSTTTPSPASSTTPDDQLMYDIDVRFGRD